MLHPRLSTLPAWLDGKRGRVIDTLALLVGSGLVVWRFLHFHALVTPDAAPPLSVLRAALPLAPPAGFGWWSWWDQSLYLEAALAWSRLDLNPVLHWYPPGYPLLGGLFARLTPADPFLVPDLLCMVAALWLFAAISARLLGRLPLARSFGAGLFIATSVVPHSVILVWVTPWTTTPETVCLLLCLLGTLRFAGRLRPRDACLAGFGALAAFAIRPADGAAVGGVCAIAATVMLLHGWPGWRQASGVVAAALAGAAAPALVFGAAYLAVNGLHLGGYLSTSSEYGFEWRLLPLRWVILMIDPRPLFVEGHGLAPAFPWIMSGVAGMAACLFAGCVPGVRTPHLVVVAAVLSDVLLFLCYRDLHPDYLWQNGTYHYFKWTLPFFGLYSLWLLQAGVAGPRLVPVAAALAVGLGLFSWRVTLADPVELAAPSDPQTLALPAGLSHLDDVLLARTRPDQTVLVPFGSEIRSPDRVFRSTFDFKLTLWPETVMVQPLRPMPPGPATLSLATAYTLDPAVRPVLARARPVWGMPCWVKPERASCLTGFLLPAPALRMGEAVRFGKGQAGEVYSLAGLASSEADGDWTDDTQASVWFRLPGGSGPGVIELTARGFVPLDDPTRVAVNANGVPAGQWQFGKADSTVRIAIPAGALRPDGNVLLTLLVANPRSPSHYTRTSDNRLLGIQIKSMRLVAE